MRRRCSARDLYRLPTGPVGIGIHSGLAIESRLVHILEMEKGKAGSLKREDALDTLPL
jgi:hypothetical protein